MTQSDEMSTNVPKKISKRGYAGRSAEQLMQERRQRLMDTALELFGSRICANNLSIEYSVSCLSCHFVYGGMEYE